MKTITISILLALTACTTIIVEPPNDAGPTLDSFTSMDGSVPDSFVEGDTLAAPDDVGTRYDVGNDATPRDIDTPIAVCDDHLVYRSAIEFCNVWDRFAARACVDGGEVTPCPYLSHLECTRCDQVEGDACTNAQGEVIGRPNSCDNMRYLATEPVCAYTVCGWFTS
jgi:hypothetical protein